MEYVWNMYGICKEYVWNMYGTCLPCALLDPSRANIDATGVSFVCRFSTKEAWSRFGTGRWQGMCMEYAWICVEYGWNTEHAWICMSYGIQNFCLKTGILDMCGIRMEYALKCMGYGGICMDYVRNMHGTCMEYAWNIHAICKQYAWNAYGI